MDLLFAGYIAESTFFTINYFVISPAFQDINPYLE